MLIDDTVTCLTQCHTVELPLLLHICVYFIGLYMSIYLHIFTFYMSIYVYILSYMYIDMYIYTLLPFSLHNRAFTIWIHIGLL